MGEVMDKHEAAAALSVAYADVVSVWSMDEGTLVTLRDGGTRLVTEDGVFATDAHPATAHLRQYEVRAEPEEVSEDDEPEDKPKPRAPRARKPAK